MLVMKFGGTSVGSPAMMETVLRIAISRLDEAPLIVSSAMSGVTNSLVALTEHTEKGDSEQAMALVESLWEKHRNAAAELLAEDAEQLAQCLAELDRILTELSSLSRGLLLIHEVSDRSRAALLAFGERLSTLLLYHKAQSLGITSQLIDARTVICTEESYLESSVNYEASFAAMKTSIAPMAGKLYITQGFIGATPSGVTSTLGRGGSDHSATIFGAGLGAKTVEIWTDVSGILTTDPRLHSKARPIDQLSYDEAAELSYFGAKVIHPATLQPAVDRGIAVYVKNTGEPDHPGTLISKNTKGPKGPRAIACKKNITVITVTSSRMLNAHGFLKAIFSVFADYGVSVDLVSTSEVSVSMTLEKQQHLRDIIVDLEQFSKVQVDSDQSIVSLVGRDLWKSSSALARVFKALTGVPVRLISLGASDINLSIAVPGDRLSDAVRSLHQEFFE